MMASNLFSRLLPTETGSPSVYETIRQHDELSDNSDVEERAGMALDEENLGERFHDYELEEALAHASESQIATQSTVFPGKGDRRQRAQDNPRNKRGSARKLPRPKWMQGSLRANETDDADDEVPASLLIEGEDEGETQKPPEPPLVGISNGEAGIPVPGPSTQETRKRWEKAQAHQQLHPDRTPSPSIPRPFPKGPKGLAFVDPKEKAMWRWANVDNLDLFLRDVYTYFLGNGFWSIMLSRVLNLLYVRSSVSKAPS
jgi:autophagy-related protein 9